jgi:hypothetical protein
VLSPPRELSRLSSQATPAWSNFYLMIAYQAAAYRSDSVRLLLGERRGRNPIG